MNIMIKIIYSFNKFYNGYLVKVPNKSIELLSKWNNYGYIRWCLLYPFPVKKGHKWYPWFKDYLESDLTEEEMHDIINHSIN